MTPQEKLAKMIAAMMGTEDAPQAQERPVEDEDEQYNRELWETRQRDWFQQIAIEQGGGI